MLSIINRVNNNYNDNKKGILISKNEEEENYEIFRGDRKKTTVAEFPQIKIPTNKKDNINIDSKNNLNLFSYTNSNYTKNTLPNTNSSTSHIKKGLF